VIPGIIDIHTHYDIETLCQPELSESLRHGVTTAMLGSCSLSTVYLDSVDAGDIFGRAEHPVESYGGLSRMVNRNDDTVSAVLVSGQLAFSAGKAAPALGKQRFGQFLRAGRPSRKLTPAA
jgi:N-acyl-D-aspartate/D-glutamate deacylase